MTRLAVVAGGMLGTALRMGAGGGRWGTFAVNVAGAAVLGWLVTRLWRPQSLTLAFAGVGVLGGMTTFSTLAFQVWDLLDAGRSGLAALYAGGSMAAGYGAAVLGAKAAAA